MSRMGKILSSQQATDWREGRRLSAWELKQEGWNQRDIARALGVSKGAVSQWLKRAKQEEGVEALEVERFDIATAEELSAEHEKGGSPYGERIGSRARVEEVGPRPCTSKMACKKHLSDY